MRTHNISTLMILTFIFCAIQAAEVTEKQAVKSSIGKPISVSYTVQKQPVKPVSSGNLSMPSKKKYDWFSSVKRVNQEEKEQDSWEDEGDTDGINNKDPQEDDTLMFNFDSEEEELK